jgi:hypothetical protein
MPISISVSDFKVTTAVCEVRHENAYLLYDRTGMLCEEIQKSYTDCTVASATPNHTVLQAQEGSFNLELGACRFSSSKPDGTLEKFASHSKRFFDNVLYNLDIRLLSRVGLRVMLRKDFDTMDQAKAAFSSLKLVQLQPKERFGAASEPHEALFRWEGNQIGTTWRLKAEAGKIDVVLPPELESDPEKAEIHKSIVGLVLDVDYYTAAPVERAQWDSTAWITQSFRTIKKGTDSIFGN